MKKSNLDKNSARYKEGTRTIIAFIFIALLFLSIALYITFLGVFKGEEYMNHPANQRQWIAEQNTLRGDITDRFGEVLAYSEKDEMGNQERKYKYPKLYAHVIGYSSKVYGKSQLELTYNKNLAGLSEVSGITGAFGENKKGDNVQLTISHKLQKKAAELMGNRNGAVVAMNPKTGEILCMVSTPSFDTTPATLADRWESLSQNEESPFLNRAVSGLYPPGSVIKTIILSAALENGLEDEVINDEGSIEINDVTFPNTKNKAYGELNLEQAYNVSSNVAFINLGVKLGDETVKSYYERFGIENQFDFELPMYKSKFGYNKKMTDDQVALASIGQGNVLVTPLQMAMMTSTIANGGVVVKPYLVKKVTNSLGVTVQNGSGNVLNRAIRETTAHTVKDYMVSTVEKGTASRAGVWGMKVAGKTGTAENEKEGKEHAWFVGFAPADDPQIAVAVVLEYNGGTGGSNSAPIASELFNYWINYLNK